MWIIGFEELSEPTHPWAKVPPQVTELEADVANARYVAYGIVAPISVCIGMVGNLLTILILRLPQFRGVTYTYFLMMAINDFLSLFFCISYLYHILEEGTYLYSTAVWYSYVEQLCVNIPMSTSVLIVICVTVDRYFSVCRPTDFKRIHTSRYARAGILSSMVIAAAVWLPTCALKKPKVYSECETSLFVPPDNRTWWVACLVTDVRHNPYYIAYAWVRQTIISFIPIGILILLNGLIVREFIRLRKKKDQMNVGRRIQDHSSPTEGRRREDEHLIKMLTSVMISFFVTMVPAGIMNALYTEFLATELGFEIFRAVANNLEIINHALNFYIYILCSKPIREAIHSLCHKRQVSNVIEIVQQAGSIAPSSSASTAKGNVTHRKPGLNADGGITQRDKSKTLSKETEPSEVSTDRDSNMDGSDTENISNDTHMYRRPNETPHIKNNKTITVNDDKVNSAECRCNLGCPETQQNPSLEGSDPSSPAVEVPALQSVGTELTSTSASVSEGNKVCYYNEAFTFQE